jgi:hypothetical protein
MQEVKRQPMTDGLYTVEKFADAVESLVFGRGDIRARLAMALYPLINLRGRTPAFATGSDLSGRFERMMARVTSTPARDDEGTIQASINKMDDYEIAWVAREILSLSHEAAIAARVKGRGGDDPA